jgi:RNA recognition motif-containing protein
MGKKLYVGNISFEVTEEALKELFLTVGEVESVKIITDAHTGQSKGFGFVEMASEEAAQKAMTDLNGSTFMERPLIVNEARPQRPREPRGSGDYRGGFGRGRGSGKRKRR